MKEKLTIKTEPITTGTSNVFSEFTISLPKPFQPKIYSTKTAPDNIEANHPVEAVKTEDNELRKA